MSTLVARARAFAIAAHEAVEQRRKWEDEPYWKHPERVAATVTEYGGTEGLICAAYLHDVLEDTGVQMPILVEEFGWDIAHAVWQLTNPSKMFPEMKRDWRKTFDRMCLAHAEPGVQTVKLADLIDNTSSITAGPSGFARIYMEEKRKLLQVMVLGNSQLYEIACGQVNQYFNDRS